MTPPDRTPRAFVLEDEKLTTTPQKKNKHANSEVRIDVQAITDDDLPTILPTVSSRSHPRYFRWGAIFGAAVFVLVLMWAALAVTQLVQSYFVQSTFLGWTALTIVGIAVAAAIAVILREVWGILRLNRISELQETVSKAVSLDDRELAQQSVSGIKNLFEFRTDMATGLREFAGHDNAIMDPRDRVNLADRILLVPLDEQAKKVIAKFARRVTLLTAVTPVAALDILFVASQNFSMLRDIATLYGGRPSTLATLRLSRMVLAHLAMAGSLALSDTMLQHFVGKGLLGRLSVRFGEGTVNGVLTARIGLAAMSVCRPVPKEFFIRHELTTLLKEVLSVNGEVSLKLAP
jgi:putative membrane protein